MLHDQHGARRRLRKRGEQRAQRLGPAGAASHQQQRRGAACMLCRGGGCGALLGRSAFILRQARDVLHAPAQALESIRRGKVGRVDGIERAGTQRLEHARGVAGDGGGHHQNGAGRVAHDATRGLHAVHLGHDQIHQDHVGPVRAALAHGLFAIHRAPRDRRAGILRHRSPKRLQRDRQVVDDRHSHETESPIRSLTVVMKVWSWKEPFVR